MKFGWQLVDEMIIDMRPHGGTGNARQALLIREPGSGGELREVDK